MKVFARAAVLGLPLAAAGLLIPMSGCSHNPELVPVTAIKQDHEGVVTSSGVTIDASGKWSGVPSELRKILTPARLTITNHSGVPIMVRYRDFDLHTSTGVTYRALPPFQIRGTVTESVPITPAFAYSGFAIAPYYSPFYPGFGVWGGPFAYDWPYYSTYWAEWPVNLPTQDMIEQAIPEGVLDNGGQVSGYLYFHKVPDKAESADLYAKLINARSGEQFGVIGIPFLIKR